MLLSLGDNRFIRRGSLPIARQYEESDGSSPFGDWFEDLDASTAARVTTAIVRLEQGNFSNVKGVGGGVLECRINFGPGYRVYFGKDGDQIILLLAGGTTKKRQQRDIDSAIQRWRDYKLRKKSG